MTLDPLSPLHVTFVGALPPPVSGMTVMTAVIVDALQRRTTVRQFNWSRGKPLSGWKWKTARGWGALKALGGLLLHGPARGENLYYAVSSGEGLYYDLAIAALARALGYRLVLHHHTYAYIVSRDWRVAGLDWLAGATGAHVVHCRLMREDFQQQYGSRAQFLIVPPTIAAPPVEACEPQFHSHFTLGFLSSLSIAKGLDDVLLTFERLAACRPDVRLILAGPCSGAKEKALVEAALARWPAQVEYRGPIYGRDKARFFADIDAFLFPTRNESWGIVLSEALAASCPVIARSRGCVPWIVQRGCGLATPPDADFVPAAVDLLTQWIDSPQEHRAARRAAFVRSHELHEDARRELPEFVDGVVAPQTAWTALQDSVA